MPLYIFVVAIFVFSINAGHFFIMHRAEGGERVGPGRVLIRYVHFAHIRSGKFSFMKNQVTTG